MASEKKDKVNKMYVKDRHTLTKQHNCTYNVPVYPMILNALVGLASRKNICGSNAPVIKSFDP